MKPNCTHFTDVPTLLVWVLDWHIECWKVWPHTFLTTFPPRELLPKFDPCHLLQKLDFSDDLKGYSKCYAVPTKKKEKQVWLSSISMVPCCTYNSSILKEIVKTNGTKLRNKILITIIFYKLLVLFCFLIIIRCVLEFCDIEGCAQEFFATWSCILINSKTSFCVYAKCRNVDRKMLFAKSHDTASFWHPHCTRVMYMIYEKMNFGK